MYLHFVVILILNAVDTATEYSNMVCSLHFGEMINISNLKASNYYVLGSDFNSSDALASLIKLAILQPSDKDHSAEGVRLTGTCTI